MWNPFSNRHLEQRLDGFVAHSVRTSQAVNRLESKVDELRISRDGLRSLLHEQIALTVVLETRISDLYAILGRTPPEESVETSDDTPFTLPGDDLALPTSPAEEVISEETDAPIQNTRGRPNKPGIRFGNGLRMVRKANNLTQRNIAELIGVSRTTMSAMERGSLLASFEQAEQLCELFNVGLKDLL